ncbi:hypothetical protein AGABI1DRAFT_135303 [Agaricus bisporus var. burnettii JB137-S8]|uniref:Uncharacterized protein n=1 Tax=Agaricus bisporus var. burnettii (strain JB137-S8 / ATCC MYA-4627 / FGSC 10392) TaxID=597362 RepID=K5WDB6_AGABU|nr:uncharacterized protein AGABI1DRAFT_135303 [Agaricus bisporus var. burnettii JB137-S8]EKM73221.1 hypothetical protein AGABI1DRAFT_135303 [Agaricus bisporus var. burnettii JB137-S8]
MSTTPKNHKSVHKYKQLPNRDIVRRTRTVPSSALPNVTTAVSPMLSAPRGPTSPTSSFRIFYTGDPIGSSLLV